LQLFVFAATAIWFRAAGSSLLGALYVSSRRQRMIEILAGRASAALGGGCAMRTVAPSTGRDGAGGGALRFRPAKPL
jgi:hypothetical protein